MPDAPPKEIDKIARRLLKSIVKADLSEMEVSSTSDKLLLVVLLLKKAGISACAVTRRLGGANGISHQILGMRVNNALLGMKGEKSWEEIEANYVSSFPLLFKPTIYSHEEEKPFMEDLSESFFVSSAISRGNFDSFAQWVDNKVALVQAEVLGLTAPALPSESKPRPRL